MARVTALIALEDGLVLEAPGARLGESPFHFDDRHLRYERPRQLAQSAGLMRLSE
jgi:hypothetical protein